MRPKTPTGLLLATCLILGGCVFAVTPLNHHFSVGDTDQSAQSTVRPVEQQGTKERQETPRQSEACLKGPEPIKDKRPVMTSYVTADDVKHPDAMNQHMLDYVKALDGYIATHQKKEADHYDHWVDRCHPEH